MYLPLKNVYVCSGSKIFSTFIGLLKSKDPKDGTEQVLLDELSTFNDYLKENVSSFCLDDLFHNLSLRVYVISLLTSERSLGNLHKRREDISSGFVLGTKVIPHEDCTWTFQELVCSRFTSFP